MKKIINLISFVVLITGTIFKLESWPGANVLILLGTLALILGIILVGYSENKEKGLNTVQNFLATLTLLAVTIGSAFKFMHWPGGNIMMVLAALLCLAIVLNSLQDSEFIQKLSSQFIITLLMVTFLATALGTKYSTKHSESKAKCNNCETNKDSTDHSKTAIDTTKK